MKHNDATKTTDPECQECSSINTHSSFCSRCPAPLNGWRVGDAGLTVFGPKTDAPAPRVLLNGKDRAVVRLAGAAPELLFALKLERGILHDEAWAIEYITDRAIGNERPAATLARIQDAAIAKATGQEVS